MAYIQKKNMLYYTCPPPTTGSYGDRDWLSRPANTNGRDYCIDTGINWTEVVATYGGIEMVVKHRGTDTWNGPFFAGTSRGMSRGCFAYWTSATAVWHFQTLTNYMNSELDLHAGPVDYDPITTLRLYRTSSEASYTKEMVVTSLSTGNEWGRLTINENVPVVPFPQTGREFNLCLFQGWWGYTHRDQSDYVVGTNTGYKQFTISGYDGTTRTTLFDGIPYLDSRLRGCLRDQVSGNLFYNLNIDRPLEAYNHS